MKIIQKILSHGLLIAFFVAVFFIYLYRGDLFPQWFDKQAQIEATPSHSAPQQSPDVSGQEPQPAQASGTDDDQGQAAALESTTEPVVEAVRQPIVTQPPSAALPAGPAAQTADVATAAQYRPVGPEETEKETYNPVVPRAVDADVAQYRPAGPDELSRQTYNPVAEVPASVVTAPEYRPLHAEQTAASESDFQSQIAQARQHYWQGDTQVAEQAYRRLTESYPERAEVWGELGNLYFGQREMVRATDAYYQAIELLIEQGDAERARQLLGAMYQLDAEKANALETRLRQAGG